MSKTVFKTVILTTTPLEVDIWSEKLVDEHILDALKVAAKYEWYPKVKSIETTVFDEED